MRSGAAAPCLPPYRLPGLEGSPAGEPAREAGARPDAPAASHTEHACARSGATASRLHPYPLPRLQGRAAGEPAREAGARVGALA